MSNSVQPYGQAPLSMGFSRQEYWSGLSFPLPGDLPDGGIEPRCFKSPALAGGLFTNRTTPVGKTLFKILAMELWQRRREVEFSSYHSTDSWLLIANPWTAEPGGLQSIGSPRVGSDWSNFITFRHNRERGSVSGKWPKGNIKGRGFSLNWQADEGLRHQRWGRGAWLDIKGGQITEGGGILAKLMSSILAKCRVRCPGQERARLEERAEEPPWGFLREGSLSHPATVLACMP